MPAIPLRSIRLQGRTGQSLDRSTGDRGEIFYNYTTNTIQVYDGSSVGGNELAPKSWVTSQIDLNTFSGSYNDLTNKPTLFDGNYNSLTNKPTLFNGDYNSLTNKPSIPVIPSLATVATSGSYTDLSNKPTLFDGNYNSLTNKPTIPSLTGYATQTYVDNAISNINLNITLPGFSNVDSLGFKRGVVVSEFSTDGALTDNATDTVPTESAVRAFVDKRLGLDYDGNAVPALSLIGPGFLPLDGSLTLTGNLNLGSYSITNLATPTNSTDAATKAYADTKAPKANPTFTGTVSGITATMVGLGNVTNESKSTMFTSPTFTGTVTVGGGGDLYVNKVLATTYGTFDLGASGTGRFATIYGTGVDVAGPLTVTGLTTLQQSTEVLNTKTSATGVVTHDFTTGAIWYHSSISANFTANFTNVPTTTNKVIAFTLILVQGATGYIPSAVQIDGAAQTIKWLGSSAPTGNANKVDIVSFTLLRTAGGWTVIGSLSTYG